MKKYLVFENQFKEFCENYRLDGFEHSYPKELLKEYPCVILVEEYNDLHGNDFVNVKNIKSIKNYTINI